MRKYFNNVNTLEELRKEYKKLLKKFHPDVDPNGTETTKEIINEYEKVFKELKEGNKNNKEAWKYDFEKDVLFRDVLEKVINFENVTIEIIGCWIWISGNTYTYKEYLKKYGFKWCANKKCWSWHAGERYYKKSKRKLTLDEIRGLYGSEEVETKKTTKIKG